jgi:hypothetical protein
MFPALAVTTPPASSPARRPDRVRRAADLERRDRLEVLELQPDVGVGQPDERRAHRRAGDPLARALDLGERDQNSTVVPVPVSAARRTRYSAAGEVLDREAERLEDRDLVVGGRRRAPPASTSPSSA